MHVANRGTWSSHNFHMARLRFGRSLVVIHVSRRPSERTSSPKVMILKG